MSEILLSWPPFLFEIPTFRIFATVSFHSSGNGVPGMDGTIKVYAMALAFFIRVAYALFSLLSCPQWACYHSLRDLLWEQRFMDASLLLVEEVTD